MQRHPEYLFVYGSLLDVDNEYGAYLKKHSSIVCEGSFNGVLYDMGEYPGALYQPASTYKVWGKVLLIVDALNVLKAIDEYEGYGETEQQPNLFVRELIPIYTDNGTIDCWVYLYNLPVDGLPRIISGRYN